MKKIALSLFVVSVIALNADGVIPISSEWTLAGAPSDISMQDVKNNSSCVKTIWQYDEENGWYLYHRDAIGTENYGYPTIVDDTLKTGSGFWVYGDSNCNISYSD
jgi:hypothetical protein